MRTKIVLLCSLLFFICSLSWGFDFGLILDQNADYGGYGDSGSFGYSGSLLPRFSALLGKSADIYASAGFKAGYKEGGEWAFLPELLRTELTFYTSSLEFKAGRLYHSDPLGFIAEGLFDGARLSLDSEAGTFSLGTFFTGLLYKGRANILMTQADREIYTRDPDFANFANNFADSYFAPRRFVSSLGWERLGLGGSLEARAALFAQFDLSAEAPLHSQYLAGKVSWPGYMFGFDVGGTLELIEEEEDFGMAAATELALHLTPPTRFPNRLSLLGRFSSGRVEGTKILAFQPITTVNQGEILKVGLSGLSIVSLDYLIWPVTVFSAGLTSTCFIRSDSGTYGMYPISGEDGGYILGTEFFGVFLWHPSSDFQVNLGGGMFMPSLGNANPEAELSWRMEINVVVSFF